MWKPEHRRAADRRGLRYDSDLTDAEWALVEPLIRPAKRGGRPRTVNVREVLNAVFYVLWTGCQWKALPKDLPPRSTVWEYLEAQSGSTWICGSGTVRSPAFIMPCTLRRGSRPDGRRARPQPSSTARASREPSKGGFARPVWL